MNSLLKTILMLIVLNTSSATSETLVFKDDFQTVLAEGWTWLRENPKSWRINNGTLEMRVEPGNMWGGDNDAQNVLLRPLPSLDKGSISIQATVENAPTSQYEQIDLVCYFDDSNMVKIGLELVDGQLSLVMGREEKDKTRTLAIIPLESTKVHLLLTIKGRNIKGEFRTLDSEDWRIAGVCELPAQGDAKVSLQAYQGSAEVEHWASIKDFKIFQADD